MPTASNQKATSRSNGAPPNQVRGIETKDRLLDAAERLFAERGFDVTAVDFAEPALRLAEQKASAAGVVCRFVRADLLALPDLDGRFDFVFDRGCFHVVRRQAEDAAVRAVSETLEPGGRLLIMTGNANEKSEPGPPVLTEAELRGAFIDFFEIEWLRECRFDKVPGDDGEPLAWLAMMRKL